MSRLAAVALAAALLAAAPSAFADTPPDAAAVRRAADQFDAGTAAFKANDFEAAASAFEAADAAVPSARALRLAIRARAEAGQGSRAATLAAAALERYPGDEATVKLARETLERLAPKLHKARVSCAPPCVLAVGTRSVPGEANTRWVVYLDPGTTTLSASFTGGAGGAKRTVEATAGGATELRFEPGEGEAAAAPAPLPKPEKKPAKKREEPAPIAPTPDTPAPARSGLHPAFFITGAVITAGLGAATIWSGVDTINNPGADAVRAACAGQGEGCALYQEGRSKQTRTNVLIGATAGAAAITVVLGVFTGWRGAKKADTAVLPTAIVGGDGAVLGAAGAF